MGRPAFYNEPYLSYDGFCKISCAVFWTKYIHKYKKILNNFSSQNEDLNPRKSTKKYSFE